MNNEPVAIRYDFDGYGYQYMDSGSGSDWQTRVDGELLYADPACKHGVDDGACKECYQDATEPVAWLWTKDGKPQSALLQEPDTVPSDPYWKDKGFKAIPLYAHPAKELHLSLQKSKQTGELLAVTYTDDEHRIVEVLWQRPPALTDEEIALVWDKFSALPSPKDIKDFARTILRKAGEK